MLLCSLLIPTAFADMSSLKLQNDARGVPNVDARGVPSFVGRHVHGKCGDLDVFDHSMIGTISGHSIAFQHDDYGVTTLTVDGDTSTGYADASGRPTHLVDPRGNVITPLTLTAEQAQAALHRNRANLAALLDSCAMIAMPTTKCGLAVNNFDAPNPDASSGTGEGGGGTTTAQRKDCTDDETSPDFWNAYIMMSGAFDTSAIDQTLECMKAKSACESVCDNGTMAIGVVCGIIATRGTAGAIVGTVCSIVDYAHWVAWGQTAQHAIPADSSVTQKGPGQHDRLVVASVVLWARFMDWRRNPVRRAGNLANKVA